MSASWSGARSAALRVVAAPAVRTAQKGCVRSWSLTRAGHSALTFGQGASESARTPAAFVQRGAARVHKHAARAALV